SLDHFVTQWMSVFTVSCGSAWNSSHVQCAAGAPVPRSVKSHTARAVRGVGPADSTGKSRVSYWPGGSRPAVGAGCRRPRNPRETKGSVIVSSYRGPSRRSMRRSDHDGWRRHHGSCRVRTSEMFRADIFDHLRAHT